MVVRGFGLFVHNATEESASSIPNHSQLFFFAATAIISSIALPIIAAPAMNKLYNYYIRPMSKTNPKSHKQGQSSYRLTKKLKKELEIDKTAYFIDDLEVKKRSIKTLNIGGSQSE